MRSTKEAAFRSASAIAAVLITACAGCAPGPPPGPDAPYASVVLVTIDTLRADHLPSYGYPRATSPFLDRLAAGGVVFTRAHATVSHTAPSHASMFTGLLPHQHGVQRNGEALSPDVPSIAQAFERAGYRTAAFTSVGFVNRTATGFRTVEGDRRKGAKTIDRALAWLGELEPGEPFFLWVHLFDVHQAELPGIRAPREHYEALRRGTPFDAETFYGFLAELHGLPDPPPGEPFPELGWDREAGRPSVLRTRDDFLRGIDHYDAQILYVDAQIERLFDAVRDRGGGPALWVVTSDHGEGLGSHGYRGHGEHVYQEQLRVPLIFHATDGSLAAGRVDALVSLVDLFPTLAATLNEAPPATQGVSLWPLLLGERASPEPRVVFAQKRPAPDVDDRVFAAIWPGHKYILHTASEDEFFDLDADPLELENEVAGDTAARHRDLLHAALEELGWSATAPAADDELPADVLEELKALGYVR